LQLQTENTGARFHVRDEPRPGFSANDLRRQLLALVALLFVESQVEEVQGGANRAAVVPDLGDEQRLVERRVYVARLQLSAQASQRGRLDNR
jgi:hypothetical protein